MNYGHILLAKKEKHPAIEYYQKSRNLFDDTPAFIKGMIADYEDFKLAQYGIVEEEYMRVVEDLRKE